MVLKCPKCRADNPDTQRFCGECGTQIGGHEPESPESGAGSRNSEKKVSLTRTLETPTESLTRGTLFAGRYEIIEELGRGGMGSVYRVYDRKVESEVALKLVKPEIAAEKKTIDRFRNELRLAREIGHRHVCRMYDLNEEQGAYYITMEYVPGEDLRSFIRRSKQLAVGTAVSIARQVAEGLAEAHRLGVIHRDLKPSNIMIDREGNARIMDFGIARSLKSRGITGEGVMIGTPEYMSPEQAEAKDIDRRSDIYSLGVILYEMVTGRLPFEGDTPLAIAMKHKGEVPKSPKILNPQISDALSQVILKCLEKDRERRYGSAEELRGDLDRIEQGLSISERAIPRRKPFTSREVTVKFTLKKITIPAAVLAVLAVAAFFLWRFVIHREPSLAPPASDRPSIAILYFSNNTGDKSFDHWRGALAGLLIDKISQSKYISVLPKERLQFLLKECNLMEANEYSSQDLERLISRGIGRHVLLGSLYKSGEHIQVNVTLHKADTWDVIAREEERGQGVASFFGIVDNLAPKIKRCFPLTEAQLANDFDMAISKMTNSPEAYTYFSEGTKYYFDIDYPKAIPLLEKAVELDPLFAIAHRHLAAIHSNMGHDDKGDFYLRKAYECSQSLPPGDRHRQLIQGEYYWTIERNCDRALDVLNGLLKDHPDDLLGNRIKYNILNIIGEVEKAGEVAGINARNFPENAFERAMFSSFLIWIGKLDKAEEVVLDFIQNQKDNVAVRRRLPAIHAHRGQYDLALAELDKLFKLDPTLFPFARLTHNRGIIHLVSGNLEKAGQEFARLMASDDAESRDRGLDGMVCLNLLQGKFRKCRELLDQAREAAKKTGDKLREARALAWIGEISLISLGRPVSALKEIEEALRVDVANWPARTQHLVRLEKAIEKLDLAYSIYDRYTENFEINDRPLYVDSLAFAFHKAGDLDGAIEKYEEIAGLTLGRYPHCDIYARSFYMLGKAYEEQGNRSKARENYRKFLDLWKDADPGIPEVEDARKRLREAQD